MVDLKDLKRLSENYCCPYDSSDSSDASRVDEDRRYDQDQGSGCEQAVPAHSGASALSRTS